VNSAEAFDGSSHGICFAADTATSRQLGKANSRSYLTGDVTAIRYPQRVEALRVEVIRLARAPSVLADIVATG
jgi:hypothetical protein